MDQKFQECMNKDAKRFKNLFKGNNYFNIKSKDEFNVKTSNTTDRTKRDEKFYIPENEFEFSDDSFEKREPEP
jgi:hypothetical protein